MILSPYEWEVLSLSMKVGIAAVTFSLPPGIAVAWLLARKNFWGKSLVNAIVHLPLVLPPVAIGYLLLLSMGRQGVIGKFLYHFFGLSFSFNWKGAALASAVVAFPLLVRSVQLAIESIDIRLEQVAHTLGVNRRRVFLTITLPLAFPGILTGSILAFARSLGEFGATITFVSNIPQETRIIPLAMYTLIESSGHDKEILRLCILSISLALLALLFSNGLMRRHNKKILG